MVTSETALTTTTRHLPVVLASDAQRIGYKMLAALDRLGFIHTENGVTYTVCFSSARLYGHQWAVYEVDAERLHHFSVADLTKPKVLAQLAAVTRRPVHVLKRETVSYVAEMRSQAAQLPRQVSLDLDARPAGDLLAPVGVGHDGAMWRSVPALGHMLIAGATGSGKSTWIHTALAALLTAAGPEQLRLALVDPKRIEFAAWANAPHLIGPVATDAETATQLLERLVVEVDRRGDLLAGALVRNLAAYNRQASRPLPVILLVVDEVIDLMLEAGNRSALTIYLKRLASKARATGVYLWLAGQHVRFDVVPRMITINLASRIAFRVQDASAARMASCPGAESISRERPGRLLAKIDGKPVFLQGYYLDDEALLTIAQTVSAGPVLSDAAPRSRNETPAIRLCRERSVESSRTPKEKIPITSS